MCSLWRIYGLCLVAGLVLSGEARAAGAAIDEVWMRYGGARLYYDALMEPKQMDMQGMRRKDPALMRNLPPITEMKAQPTRRRTSARAAKTGQAAKPAAQVSAQQSGQKSAGLPSGQATSAKPSLSSGAASQAGKAPTATISASGARPAAAKNGGALGGLTPTQNKDDVFVPPPAGAAPAAPAAASSSASTTSAGNGGQVSGAGQTAR